MFNKVGDINLFKGTPFTTELAQSMVPSQSMMTQSLVTDVEAPYVTTFKNLKGIANENILTDSDSMLNTNQQFAEESIVLW